MTWSETTAEHPYDWALHGAIHKLCTYSAYTTDELLRILRRERPDEYGPGKGDRWWVVEEAPTAVLGSLPQARARTPLPGWQFCRVLVDQDECETSTTHVYRRATEPITLQEAEAMVRHEAAAYIEQAYQAGVAKGREDLETLRQAGEEKTRDLAPARGVRVLLGGEKVWLWRRGDGADDLANLSCPVVIDPLDLLQLIGGASGPASSRPGGAR